MTKRLPSPPAPGPLEDYAESFNELFGTLAQRSRRPGWQAGHSPAEPKPNLRERRSREVPLSRIVGSSEMNFPLLAFSEPLKFECVAMSRSFYYLLSIRLRTPWGCSLRLMSPLYPGFCTTRTLSVPPSETCAV